MHTNDSHKSDFQQCIVLIFVVIDRNTSVVNFWDKRVYTLNPSSAYWTFHRPPFYTCCTSMTHASMATRYQYSIDTASHDNS
jgi:hypothetical protein